MCKRQVSPSTETTEKVAPATAADESEPLGCKLWQGGVLSLLQSGSASKPTVGDVHFSQHVVSSAGFVAAALVLAYTDPLEQVCCVPLPSVSAQVEAGADVVFNIGSGAIFHVAIFFLSLETAALHFALLVHDSARPAHAL